MILSEQIERMKSLVGLNESNDRMLGKSLALQISTPYVTIYRACSMDMNIFVDRDYITLSKKFAIEHAENNHVYHEDNYHVIQSLVDTKFVFDAYNPGEYFYSGPDKKGREIYVTKGPDSYEGFINEGKGSPFDTLKKNKVPLTDEERKEVMDADAVWHHGLKGEATPAVWKSKNKKGDITYVTNTHRAYQTRKSLKAAISIYHSFIKGTA